MEELVEVMLSRTARDTGPVANVHYMAGLGLINCKRFEESVRELEGVLKRRLMIPLPPVFRLFEPGIGFC